MRGEELTGRTKVKTAIRGIAATQIKRIRRSFDRAEKGDPETVHDARVATRRLKTLLGLTRSGIPSDTHKALAKPLKKIGSSLGDVRDLDVRCKLAVELGLPNSKHELEEWKRERPRAIEKAVRRHADFDWEAWHEDFSEAVSSLRRPVSDMAPVWIGEMVAEAEARLAGSLDVESLHQLRILSKQLRYTLEFFADALPFSVKDTVKTLTAVQDGIGDWRDRDLVRREAGMRGLSVTPVARTATEQWRSALLGLGRAK